MKSIKIDFPSITENIRIVESFIDNAKEKYQLTDEVYGNIMVAVTESVNNAIQHGNKNVMDKSVYLSLIFTEGSIQFEIEDEGDGFDYETLPDPTAPENIDKPGGRGIFLMKHLSDEVAFEDEGKRVILTFYLN
ncbi:ATP-binding protein [Mangrovivirga sp. M17]|uniref:ATP-binding protein n=1 Tax=Mangrovivirga halotolerans TaxID=2993936 RepID=A0ABT3RSN6_9BACT|nr:ATP-binding protein [Mangrovivirga halotolerans]MCX2744800.1 ATP-binding protein [Mangrovivirga halotolerans]